MQIATTSQAILTEHGERLRATYRQRVTRSWAVFSHQWDDLSPATPVVLELEGGVQLELWTVYVAEFGVTWNELDLSGVPSSGWGGPIQSRSGS